MGKINQFDNFGKRFVIIGFSMGLLRKFLFFSLLIYGVILSQLLHGSFEAFINAQRHLFDVIAKVQIYFNLDTKLRTFFNIACQIEKLLQWI